MKMSRTAIVLGAVLATLAVRSASAQAPAAPDLAPADAAAQTTAAAPAPIAPTQLAAPATLRQSPSPGSLSLHSPVPASADPQELERFAGLLRYYSSQSRGYRTWGGIAALAVGAAAIPSGVALLQHDEKSIPGTVVVAGGAGALAGGLLLLISPLGPTGQHQRLSAMIEDQRELGKSPTDIIGAVESKWREQARQARSFRRPLGIISAGLGALFVAGGTVLSFADMSNSDVSVKQQAGAAAALLGLGYFSVIAGIQSFFFESSIESTWKAYEYGKARPRTEAFVRFNGLGYGVVPGGGVISLGLAL